MIRLNDIIIENKIYEVGVDCCAGYYMFKTQDTSKSNAYFHKYTVYPPNGFHRCSSGIWGCAYVSNEVKFIEIENGIAIYYDEMLFNLYDVLFATEHSQKKDENKVYSNEVSDIRIYSIDLTCQYFSGAESGVLSKQCICSINNHLLWVGLIDINSYRNSSLLQIGIKNNTTNKTYTYGKKGMSETGNQEFNLDYFYQDINYTHVYNDANNDKYWYLVELPTNCNPYDDMQLDWIMCNKSKKRLKKAGHTFEDTYADEILRLKKVLHLYISNEIAIDIESEIKPFEKAPDFFIPCIKFLEEKWKEKKKIERMDIENREFTFHVGMSYDKKYYCASKLADKAKKVVKDPNRNVYYVTYDSTQMEEIVLMYYNLKTIFNEDKSYMLDISNFINKYVFEEYLIVEINQYIATSRAEYSYYNFVTDSILVRIQQSISKKKRNKLNSLYSQMIKEKRVFTKWSNEYKLFSLVNNLVDDAIYQYRCVWLGTQSFDIFLPSYNIAIEYQGQQHYEAIELFGGEESLKSNQERDERKRNLAEANGVKIVEWRYDILVNDDNIYSFLIENNIGLSIKKEKYAPNNGLASGLIMAPVQSHGDKKKPTEKKIANKPIPATVIRKYSLDGTFLKEFETILFAVEQTSVSERSIKKCLYGERKSGGGFLWKRVNRSSEQTNIDALVIEKTDNTAKLIYQYDIQNNLIAEFQSLRQASTATGVNQRSISDALKGVQKTAGGFCWKYKQ